MNKIIDTPKTVAKRTKHIITKRTYAKNVRKYAKAAAEAFHNLLAFADKYRPAAGVVEYMDELYSIVDAYSRLNCDILNWCHRNGVDTEAFSIDINNKEG